MNDEQFRLLLERTPTLRDLIAIAALNGIIACHADSDISLPKDGQAAEWAYEYADAMLIAREPKPPADIGTPPEFRDCPPS